MTFDPRHPRGVYPGAARLQPQYVLITDDGEERSSNVTTERIYKAVYEIAANKIVTLEKCQPVIINNRASVFAISFYDDSRVAVFFKIEGSVMRMVDTGYTSEQVADMMCDFLDTAAVPDMNGWVCEEFTPMQQKSESRLTVDGQNFRYFDFSDVMAALEDIIEGNSKWMLYDFSGDESGYVHISRLEDDDSKPSCSAEWVKWTRPEPTGFRTVISDFDSFRNWLWNFPLDGSCPAPGSGWESFDVTDYFEKLIQTYSQSDER